MTQNTPIVTGGICEGAGCTYRIEIGLALRFCPSCRLKQPIPRRNRLSTQDRYNEKRRRERALN